MFPNGGIARGSCRYGVRSCVEGKWSLCRGAIAPRARDRCDIPGNDDNCNGRPNEGCEEQPESQPSPKEEPGGEGGSGEQPGGSGGQPGGGTPDSGGSTCLKACSNTADCRAGEFCAGEMQERYCYPKAVFECQRSAGTWKVDPDNCQVSCSTPPDSATCEQSCESSADCGTGELCLTEGEDKPNLCSPARCLDCSAVGDTICMYGIKSCVVFHCGEKTPELSEQCRRGCKSDADCSAGLSCFETSRGNLCLSRHCQHCFDKKKLCVQKIGDCGFQGCSEPELVGELERGFSPLEEQSRGYELAKARSSR